MNALIWLAVFGWSLAALATVCAVESDARLRQAQVSAAYYRELWSKAVTLRRNI